jgi:hypothetical protein
MTKKIIRYVAAIAGAALLLSAASGASAAPLTFVWNPPGATPARWSDRPC